MPISSGKEGRGLTSSCSLHCKISPPESRLRRRISKVHEANVVSILILCEEFGVADLDLIMVYTVEELISAQLYLSEQDAAIVRLDDT